MTKAHNPIILAARALRDAQMGIEALHGAVQAIVRATTLLRKRKGKIVVTGLGKSAYVGMKIAATLTSLGEHASFLHPVEAFHGDLGMVKKGDVLLAISFSGESPEVVRVAAHLIKNAKIPLIAVCGSKNSSLGQLASVVVPIRIKSEGSPHDLAPMASTTASLVAGDMLAAALVNSHEFKEKHFARFHPGGSLGLKLKSVREVMDKKVPVVQETIELSKALTVITQKKKGIAAVVSQRGILVGSVTDGDIRRFVMNHESIARRTVHEAMTRKPKTISVSDSLKNALISMEQHKITSLFVLNHSGHPIGIVHIHDILGGIA